VPVSAGAAAAFEAEGHQLLLTGRYAAAIDDLRSAIQASGGSLSRCAEPTSEACLTYAYALYDLGRALQLDGDPAAAIPILNERLRIDNQRETVQQELEVARAARA
jgi:tetratricopeptide (TPR) repeat protein